MQKNTADELYQKNKEMFYMLTGVMISSQSLRTITDCETSIHSLQKLKKDIEDSKIIDSETKKEWLEFCEQGIFIAERDKSELIENGGRNIC